LNGRFIGNKNKDWDVCGKSKCKFRGIAVRFTHLGPPPRLLIATRISIPRVSKMSYGTVAVVSVKAVTPFILHILMTVSETLTSG
jgi:hypothetical protein